MGHQSPHARTADEGAGAGRSDSTHGSHCAQVGRSLADRSVLLFQASTREPFAVSPSETEVLEAARQHQSTEPAHPHGPLPGKLSLSSDTVYIPSLCR